jgi:hypothetical protein
LSLRGVVGRVRLAVDDDAEDPVLAAEALEREDLLVYPVRARGARRADDDLADGLVQGFVDGGAKIGGAGELLAVAEDRREALRYRAAGGGQADELLGRPVGFQRLVQPAAPLCVAVAVAEEGPVLGRV